MAAGWVWKWGGGMRVQTKPEVNNCPQLGNNRHGQPQNGTNKWGQGGGCVGKVGRKQWVMSPIKNQTIIICTTIIIMPHW